MKKVATATSALRGAGALAFSTCAIAASMAVIPEDPVVALIDRYFVVWPKCPADGSTAEKRWNDEVSDLEASIGKTPPMTKAGALAVVKFLALKLRDDSSEQYMHASVTRAVGILSREV